jgi:hypothetical protein
MQVVPWYLATVHVRFARAGSGGLLPDGDLDALADLLIAFDNVVTVRVEQTDQPTVYRIDIDTATRRRATALATAPLDAVCEQLGLVSKVVAVTAERSSASHAIGEDLPRVENPERIQRRLDGAHRRH